MSYSLQADFVNYGGFGLVFNLLQLSLAEEGAVLMNAAAILKEGTV